MASAEGLWNNVTPAYYSFIDPERMKGWVGLVGWPTVDSLPTRQLYVERRRANVHRSPADVQSGPLLQLLCHTFRKPQLISIIFGTDQKKCKRKSIIKEVNFTDFSDQSQCKSFSRFEGLDNQKVAAVLCETESRFLTAHVCLASWSVKSYKVEESEVVDNNIACCRPPCLSCVMKRKVLWSGRVRGGRQQHRLL